MDIPCVEHGLVSREINKREQSFGTSSRQTSAINDAFRTSSAKPSKKWELKFETLVRTQQQRIIKYWNVYHFCCLFAIYHPKCVTVVNIHRVLEKRIDPRPNDIWKMWSRQFHVHGLGNDNGIRYLVVMYVLGYPIHRKCFRMHLMWTRIDWVDVYRFESLPRQTSPAQRWKLEKVKKKGFFC